MDDLLLAAAWEVDVALEHVSRGAVTVTLGALVIAITQVDDVVARGAFSLPVGARGATAERRPRVATASAPLTTWTVRDGALVVEIAGSRSNMRPPCGLSAWTPAGPAVE